jgi:hypothetical protein
MDCGNQERKELCEWQGDKLLLFVHVMYVSSDTNIVICSHYARGVRYRNLWLLLYVHIKYVGYEREICGYCCMFTLSMWDMIEKFVVIVICSRYVRGI